MFRLIENAVVIEVKVIPGSKACGVLGIEGERLKVKLRSPPEGGQANKELIEVLCYFFTIRPYQVKIIKGAHSQLKKVAIASAPSCEILRKLSALRDPTEDEESEFPI